METDLHLLYSISDKLSTTKIDCTMNKAAQRNATLATHVLQHQT